jgi:hypothetical protein
MEDRHWARNSPSLPKMAKYRSRCFGGLSWDVQRGASIRKIRANSTRGSMQIPSSVRSLRLEWWRWLWQASILQARPIKQASPRSSEGPRCARHLPAQRGSWAPLTAAPNYRGGGPQYERKYPCRRAPLSLSYASRFTACPKWQLPFLFASSALAPKNFAACVNYLTLGRRRICEPLFRQLNAGEGNAHA